MKTKKMIKIFFRVGLVLLFVISSITTFSVISKNNNSAYEGNLKIYIVEPVSRYMNYDKDQYHYGFLDFALDETIIIEPMGSYTNSISWNGQNEGFLNVKENNIIVIAVLYNSEEQKGYADPPSGNEFDAYYVDAAAGATPGYTERNIQNGEFTHTVFIEEGTATWCPYCPAMAEALNDVYNSGDYPFFFVAMVTDKNTVAKNRMNNDLNIRAYPTAYFDGGYSVLVGGHGQESYYRSRIGNCGARETQFIDLILSVEWTEDGTINIDVTIKPNNTPEIPTITGPAQGNAGEVYDYFVNSADPDQNDLYYYIDWGDDNIEEWIGPYNSGSDATFNHNWSEQGIYVIKVKARDIYGSETDWTTLEITMPKNKSYQFNELIQKLLLKQEKIFTFLKNFFIL